MSSAPHTSAPTAWTPRLAGKQPEPFDDRRFRWLLRDSGLLAELTEAPLRVLWFAYALSDADGRFDLPKAHVAQELGYDRKTVTRAVARLAKLGLFAETGRSEHDPRIKRYALQMLADPAAEPDRSASEDRGASAPHEPDRGRSDPGYGAQRSRIGDPCAPQRHPKETLKENPPPQRAAPGSEARGLWDAPPAYDAAAAAVLVRAGFSPNEAKGIVGQYRPTVAQVRNVIANAAAWRAEHRRGREKRPLHDRRRFIRAEIRRYRFALDDRVDDIRRRARGRARARRQSKPAPLDRRQADQDRAALDAAFAALDAEQVETLRRRALDAMPPAIRRLHADADPAESRQLKAAIVELAQ